MQPIGLTHPSTPSKPAILPRLMAFSTSLELSASWKVYSEDRIVRNGVDLFERSEKTHVRILSNQLRGHVDLLKSVSTVGDLISSCNMYSNDSTHRTLQVAPRKSSPSDSGFAQGTYVDLPTQKVAVNPVCNISTIRTLTRKTLLLSPCADVGCRHDPVLHRGQLH